MDNMDFDGCRDKYGVIDLCMLYKQKYDDMPPEAVRYLTDIEEMTTFRSRQAASIAVVTAWALFSGAPK